MPIMRTPVGDFYFTRASDYADAEDIAKKVRAAAKALNLKIPKHKITIRPLTLAERVYEVRTPYKGGRRSVRPKMAMSSCTMGVFYPGKVDLLDRVKRIVTKTDLLGIVTVKSLIAELKKEEPDFAQLAESLNMRFPAKTRKVLKDLKVLLK